MIFNLRSKEVLGVIESDSTNLIGSYDSTLKINKIGGVCVQGENPSPTNPQEIKNSVVSKIKIHGKNFLNIGEVNKNTSGLVVNVKNNVITVKGTAEKDTLLYAMGGYATEEVLFTLGIGTYSLSDGLRLINNTDNRKNYKGTFTLTEPFKVTTLQIMNPNNGSGTFNTEDLFDFSINAMLSMEDKLLPFEPYMESVVTLSQPIELYGVGDVQDTIEGGKVKRRIAKGVLNGSENWKYTNSPDRLLFYLPRANTPFKNAHYDVEKVTCISDKLTSIYWNNVSKMQDNVIVFNNDSIAIRILSFNGDINAFKAWLAENPITVVYEIAEPVIEDLPLTDQLALNSLKTFQGGTHVEFDGEVQATLNSNYATNPVGTMALNDHRDLSTVKNQVGALKNVIINTAGGYDTMENDIISEFAKLEHGVGLIALSNGASVFHGTYYKYSNEIGSITFQDATSNDVYVWSYVNGVATLDKVFLSSGGMIEEIINKATDDTQSFATKISHGLIYSLKDDVTHGMVGANSVVTNGITYKTMNVRADKNADFIALTNEKTNSVCYYMNINKVPFTANNYTEAHYFGGDVRLVGNLKATGGVYSEETHVKKMGVNGGVAQPVEWVYDQALGRYVLCTVTGQ